MFTFCLFRLVASCFILNSYSPLSANIPFPPVFPTDLSVCSTLIVSTCSLLPQVCIVCVSLCSVLICLVSCSQAKSSSCLCCLCLVKTVFFFLIYRSFLSLLASLLLSHRSFVPRKRDFLLMLLRPRTFPLYSDFPFARLH